MLDKDASIEDRTPARSLLVLTATGEGLAPYSPLCRPFTAVCSGKAISICAISCCSLPFSPFYTLSTNSEH